MIVSKNNSEDVFLKKNEDKIMLEIFDDFLLEKKISCDSGSSLKYLLISYQSEINIDFETLGENVDMDIYCILLGESNKKNIAKFICNLKNSFCKANMYSLGILLDKSYVSIDGGVKIGEGINNVEGYLLEENIILGDNIKIKTLPLLDVKSNDIKASHGARIHRLNEEKKFYMQSKGLTNKQSCDLVVEGYINNVFEKFKQYNKEEIENLKSDFLERLF